MTEKPCLKCRNSAEEACKKRVFNKPPEILIIHLKRFSHDGRWMRKIHTPIECPMILDIGKYTENGTTCRYQLYSIANHIGGSSSGHYTATCRDPADTKNWYCHDDETTSDGINETDVTTKDAYILFYKKESMLCSNKSIFHFFFFLVHKKIAYDVLCVRISLSWVN